MAESDAADISVRELARRAGVSPNAAYRHFASKDALLAALAAEGFRRLGAAGARTNASSVDPNAGLIGYGRAYVDFALRDPALFRLMFGGRVSADASEELATAGAESFGALQSGVAAAANLPLEHPEVAAITAYAWALVHGLAHLLLDGQLDRLAVDRDRLIDAVLAIAATTHR